jgi:hypothetical protein
MPDEREDGARLPSTLEHELAWSLANPSLQPPEPGRATPANDAG